ncbi:hypothetical protein NDU88_001726 [Pleurodeles waltl]|uniref:Uncharacterized protein n=1 Tax=Pleurodeles waltl TaxID=8319 RepID=A0AAV7VAI0_PLEWA|nr:hypothetical protein NDU88_001726 [Pleurodeles waltl]
MVLPAAYCPSQVLSSFDDPSLRSQSPQRPGKSAPPRISGLHSCVHHRRPDPPAARGPSRGSPYLCVAHPRLRQGPGSFRRSCHWIQEVSCSAPPAQHGPRTRVPTPIRGLTVRAARGLDSWLPPAALRREAKSKCRTGFKVVPRHRLDVAPGSDSARPSSAAASLRMFRRGRPTHVPGFRVALRPSSQPFPTYCVGQFQEAQTRFADPNRVRSTHPGRSYLLVPGEGLYFRILNRPRRSLCFTRPPSWLG